MGAYAKTGNLEWVDINGNAPSNENLETLQKMYNMATSDIEEGFTFEDGRAFFIGDYLSCILFYTLNKKTYELNFKEYKSVIDATELSE